MHVLILARNRAMSEIWARHLRRGGGVVTICNDQAEAIQHLCRAQVDVIVLDLMIQGDSSAIAVADFASYRQPGAKVVLISNGRFFSDGSIFHHMPNACAIMPDEVAPEDLGAVIEYHGEGRH